MSLTRMRECAHRTRRIAWLLIGVAVVLTGFALLLLVTAWSLVGGGPTVHCGSLLAPVEPTGTSGMWCAAARRQQVLEIVLLGGGALVLAAVGATLLVRTPRY